MSDPASLSDFVKTMQRLHAAIGQSDTEGSRLQAEAELADFLRASVQGKLQAWYDAKAKQARNDD